MKWYRFDELEGSWEKVETIREDVPVLLQAFCDDDGSDYTRLELHAHSLPVAAAGPGSVLPISGWSKF